MTPYLIIMCGPPGTGKTTKAKEIFERVTARGFSAEVISKDDIRLKYLTKEDNYWAHEDKVIRDYKARLLYSLMSNDYTIADASHLLEQQRQELINYLHQHCGYFFITIIAAAVKTPVEFAIQRDAIRKGRRKVGAATIKEDFDFNLNIPTHLKFILEV